MKIIFLFNFFSGALVNAIVTLTGNLEIQLKLLGSSNKKKTEDEDLINIFIIIIEIPILGSSEFIDVALPHVSIKTVLLMCQN